MPNKSRNKKRKRAARTKTSKAKASSSRSAPVVKQTPPSEAAGAEEQADSKRFVDDLLVRGEAAPLDSEGKLPLQATHIIQGKKPDGSADVKRARYKLF